MNFELEPRDTEVYTNEAKNLPKLGVEVFIWPAVLICATSFFWINKIMSFCLKF